MTVILNLYFGILLAQNETHTRNNTLGRPCCIIYPNEPFGGRWKNLRKESCPCHVAYWCVLQSPTARNTQYSPRTEHAWNAVDSYQPSFVPGHNVLELHQASDHLTCSQQLQELALGGLARKVIECNLDQKARSQRRQTGVDGWRKPIQKGPLFDDLAGRQNVRNSRYISSEARSISSGTTCRSSYHFYVLQVQKQCCALLPFAEARVCPALLKALLAIARPMAYTGRNLLLGAKIL